MSKNKKKKEGDGFKVLLVDMRGLDANKKKVGCAMRHKVRGFSPEPNIQAMRHAARGFST